MSVTKIIGWVLSGLLALLLIGLSAPGKFMEFDGKAEMFAKLGIDKAPLHVIGALEILCAVLFVIPWTGFLGAILLTGYLGGAIFTHVRIGDDVTMHVIIAVVVWIALGLRQPEIFQLAIGRSLYPEPTDPANKPAG